jgi:2-keto-4-pentenoate hydratase/2-oxohepta-3-ene-1,7-dioic acid hydratase in catechol pathway
MKLIRFRHERGVSVGALVGDHVIDASSRLGTHAIADLLTTGMRQRLAEFRSRGDFDFAFRDVALLQPLDAHARIFAIGINYKSHAQETGREMPIRPSSFIRTQESLVAHEEPLVVPSVSDCFDFEGELAVVIGKAAYRVPESDALSFVGGYTCFNDGSLRDYQKFSVTAGKNFDRSGSCGPFIADTEEIPDPSRLTLVTRLNGEEVQRSTTDLLIYPIPLLVSFLSQITALRPGDLIATGTPSGVGARRTPPLWMKDGDRVEVEISGIGVLANDVVKEQ